MSDKQPKIHEVLCPVCGETNNIAVRDGTVRLKEVTWGLKTEAYQFDDTKFHCINCREILTFPELSG